jgi:hypothetical protein
MFRLLAAGLALYVAYAVLRGEVYVKAGPSGRSVSRTDSPEFFWTTIAIYAGLAVALATVF